MNDNSITWFPNAFRVTGPLWGEPPIFHRWIPPTRGQFAELWYSLCHHDAYLSHCNVFFLPRAAVFSPPAFAAGSRMTTVDTGMQCSTLGSSLTPSTREPSAATVLTLNPFGFESKTAFNASNELTRSRSEHFTLRPPVIDDDIWKRPPPDFRPQVYQPKPPKRNSRESMKPWNYGTFPGHKKPPRKEEKVFLPSIFKVLSGENAEEVDFQTHVHIMDPYEAKRDAAKNLMNEREPYVLPQPHDHRGVSITGHLWGNPSAIGGFLSQRTSNQYFYVFFALILNQVLQ